MIALGSIFLAFVVLSSLIGWPWLKAKASRKPAIGAVIAASAAAMLIYVSTGAPHVVSVIKEREAQQMELIKKAAQLELIERKNGHQYADLGRIYIELGRFGAAVEPMRRAVVQTQGNAQYIFLFGKAQMLAAGGEITSEAKSAFTMAATLEPFNPHPQFFLALEQIQSGNKAAAKQALVALKERGVDDQMLFRMIEDQLSKLRQEEVQLLGSTPTSP